MEFIKLIPEIAKGSAWVVLTCALLWIIWESRKESVERDKAHREDRQKQDETHQKQIEKLMDNHSEERSEWVGTLKAASAEFSQASLQQGDRLATALINALRPPRP